MSVLQVISNLYATRYLQNAVLIAAWQSPGTCRDFTVLRRSPPPVAVSAQAKATALHRSVLRRHILYITSGRQRTKDGLATISIERVSVRHSRDLRER